MYHLEAGVSDPPPPFCKTSLQVDVCMWLGDLHQAKAESPLLQSHIPRLVHRMVCWCLDDRIHDQVYTCSLSQSM